MSNNSGNVFSAIVALLFVLALAAVVILALVGSIRHLFGWALG